MTLASRLPTFTWDRIAPLREKAGLHPDGLVDLSVGTPVDPVPDLIRSALAGASNAPGYPATWGTPGLRSAAAGWLDRTLGVSVPADDVLPVIGTKELIAWLPALLGLGPGDVITYPELAYPTYDIGVRLAGATGVAVDGVPPADLGRVRLVWVNSPSNPTGRCWRRTSATSRWAGTSRRCRCCIRMCAGARFRACWLFIRCPSGPTWPVTGRVS
jgi:aspartate/methionine/tyrosine aminotransferase